MPFKRSISNVPFASTLLDESSDGSLSPTSTFEDVKPAIEDVKPVLEEDVKLDVKSIKREDTPHPLAKKSKTRGLTGNDAINIKKAQEKHIESGSPSAAKFKAPVFAVSPTHAIKGRICLTTLACKGCGTTVQRAILSSSTDKLAEHIKKCPAELPDAAQATLEALGVTGSNTIQPEEVLQTLVTWIAENSRPFRLVNDRQLRRLFMPAVTRILSSNTPRRISDATSELYKLMQPIIKAKLGALPGKLYLDVDAWTAPNGAEVAGIVIFGRNAALGLSKPSPAPGPGPARSRLTESHTGEYLAEVIFELLHKYNLKNRLSGICSDNASSMAKAMELLGEKGLRYFERLPSWLRCFAHILDLVTKAILRNFANGERDEAPLDLHDDFEPSFDEAVKAFWRENDEDGDEITDINSLTDEAFDKLMHEIDATSYDDEGHLRPRVEAVGDFYTRKSARSSLLKFQVLAKRLRFSGTARRAWAETCARLGLRVKHVPRAVKTRWNTVLTQCSVVSELHEVIRAFQHLRAAGIKPTMRIEDCDLKLAGDLATVLAPLASLTGVVSKARSARVGSVIGWIDHLTSGFDDILQTPAYYPPALHNAALDGWTVLQKYYAYTDDSKFYRLGVLLHPSLRIAYFRTAKWKEEWIMQARNLLINEFEPYKLEYAASLANTSIESVLLPDTVLMPPPPPPQRSRIAAHLAAHASEINATAACDPLEAFINGAPIVNAAGGLLDAWEYWVGEKKAGREHGGLTELALDVFCAPVSSVSAERAFAVGRHLVAEKRHGLGADKICESLALGSWSREGLVPDGRLAHGARWRKSGKGPVKMEDLMDGREADGVLVRRMEEVDFRAVLD